MIGVGIICFFVGGLFGFMMSALCMMSSQNDTYKDAELLAQMTEEENG